MLEATTTRADKPADNSEVQARLSEAAAVTSGSIPIPGKTSNDVHMQAGTLPALSIDGADANNTHWGPGAMAVTKDLVDGAYDQITGHPGQVALSGAIGMAIGASATLGADGVAAAATAVGVTVAAPEVLLGAAAIGTAYAGYELYEHAGKWIDDAKTVADQNDYSASQVAQANTDLQNVGSGGVDVAAGIMGGAAGSYIGGSMAMAEANARAAATPSLDAPATPVQVIAAPPGDASAPQMQAAATPPGDAPATTAHAVATSAADAPAAQAQPGDAQAQAAEMTPEEQAVANSIKANQALFNAADIDTPVYTAGKQDYNVRFEKVTRPTQVQTLEGLKTGTSETAQPGQWIATRLDSDGNPVMENGIQNSWPVNDKTILKTYQATPEDLQSGQFVAATRTDAPPVHMIQLKAPLTIQTPWGQMSGEPGDRLANYDYAGGKPGDNYAIVTATSFNQTYKTLPVG